MMVRGSRNTCAQKITSQLCASHCSADSEFTEAGAVAYNLPSLNMGKSSQSQPSPPPLSRISTKFNDSF